ncbi:hypothetical protein [Nitratifractor sp.]
MKALRSMLYPAFFVTLSVLWSGCSDSIGSLTSMTAFKTDLDMPTIRGVKTVVDKTSVGFEWPAVTDKRVEGIDVYRARPAAKGAPQKMQKIATIANRYATHYVDTTIQPDSDYLYTFRTFGVLFGSAPGQVIRVHTAPRLPAVKIAKLYQPDAGVIKLLWVPHPDPRVADYVIERRLEGKEWKYLDTVKGRLMPEYIDMSPAKGRRYDYRVVGRTADGVRTRSSAAQSITIR